MLAYSGRGKLVTEPLDLTHLVRELLGLLRTAVSKKAELRLNSPETLPLVLGDATQIRQVVLNLILNASDALRGDSGTITVTVSHQQLETSQLNATLTLERLEPGDYVCLEVADTGMGMSPATQERIFEPFFTTKFTGRGLGLSAVVGIVKSHHGLLLLSSEEGKGTTFMVALPVTLASASADEPHEEVSELAMTGTVLLVDDEEPVRRVGVKLLERHGLQTLLASDGREALELYRQHQHEISLVLLDMTMPGMDGEQTLKELRKLNPDVRVVMATGFNELETAERLSNWNLSGTLQKPYDIVTLRRVLKKAWPRG
jgi:CheY-like chemotaxis protein/two-component sensor histidine kinase